MIFPPPLCPPASFSFYKSVRKLASGQNGLKIYARSYLSGSLTKELICTMCSYSNMLEDVLLPFGPVFLGFTANSFFHVVGMLKEYSFVLKD